MSTRTISTAFTVDAEKQFKQEMSEVNSHLKTMRSEAKLLTEQFHGQANSVEALTAKDELLRAEVEEQEKKVKLLEEALEEASRAYEDAPEKVEKYQQSLNNAKADLIKMQRELQDTEKYLDEAGKSADGCAKSIDEFGNKARDAGGGLMDFSGIDGIEGLLGKLGDLKGALVGGAVVGGLMAAKDAVLEIEESTREYRRTMGLLEESSKKAGYTAEETQQIYGRLFSVMGDNQAAAEATTQLQSLGLEQFRLNELTDATIGAWVAMGQSAPIESIAEAVQQTINAGTATGAFADLLVMAGVSEDEFNEKLKDCQTESGRFNVVLQELSRQGMAEMGQGWIDTNDDIVKANEATGKMEEAMGKLGEVLAPVASGIISLGADAIEKVLVPALETAFELARDFTEQTKEMAKEMREAGGNLTGQGFNFDFARSPDGSHAGGLAYVPYDGYIAQLHQGEAVLTAAENRLLQEMSRGLRAPQGGVTAPEMRQIMASSVNAIAAGQGGGGPVPANITLVTPDGAALATWLLPDIRRAEKSDPEVAND